MSKLKEILQAKKDHEERLKSAAEFIVKQLVETGALKIVLFGSMAEGNVDIHSDLDLLVIMPPTKSGKEWMKIVYDNVERGIASDIIVYNQKEFEDELPIKSFLRHALGSGRVGHIRKNLCGGLYTQKTSSRTPMN